MHFFRLVFFSKFKNVFTWFFSDKEIRAARCDDESIVAFDGFENAAIFSFSR